MKFLVLLISLFLLSCSGGESEYQDIVFVNTETGARVQSSSFTEGVLQTNRKYKSEIDLLNYLEPLNVEIQGRFLVEEDESGHQHESNVEVHAYTTSVQRPDGSYLKFTRSKDSDNSIDVKFFSRDFNEVKLCVIPNAFSINGNFSFKIQFVNSLGGGSVAIWNLYKSPDAQINRNKEIFNLNTADCTSKNNSQTLISLLGLGNSWGVVLNAIEVSKISRKVSYDI